MLDLDAIDALLPPGSRLGNIGCVGDNQLTNLVPGTWTCTLLSRSQKRGESRYAVGYGPTPSVAFAKAKSDWNRVRESEPKPVKRSLPDITLDDLEL